MPITRIERIAFTGHRPQRIGSSDESHPSIQWVKQELEKTVHLAYAYNKTRYFIAGGAQGVDTWAAEIVLGLKKQDPSVQLTVAVPCKGQETNWSQEAKARYYRVLEGADHVKYVHNGPYTSTCMMERNHFMVSQADGLIAVWDGRQFGGTFQTLNMARRMACSVFVVDTSKRTTYKVC